mgnify:CR=1 FL=1
MNSYPTSHFIVPADAAADRDFRNRGLFYRTQEQTAQQQKTDCVSAAVRHNPCPARPVRIHGL